MNDPDVVRRLDKLDREVMDLERGMWGSEHDPESGLVHSVRRIEAKQEEARKQNYTIMAGVVVAIVTPAATILLTKAAG